MAESFETGGVAVVTGAAMGIGRAAALHCARAGMKVVAVDQARDRLIGVCDEIVALAGEANVLRIVADLGDPDDVAGMAGAVSARFGPPTFLMNNAVTRAGKGFEAPLRDWRAAFDVNFWGVVETVNAFLPAMRAKGGVIVNVGSKQGITNPPGHPVYNIAKAALKTYTEALEHELRGAEGPRVTAHLLVPGWTTTGDAERKPGAWLPEQVVERMAAGLAAGDFYIICPDGETTAEMDAKRIAWGAGDIIENRPPLSRWHPDWKEKAAEACS